MNNYPSFKKGGVFCYRIGELNMVERLPYQVINIPLKLVTERVAYSVT